MDAEEERLRRVASTVRTADGLLHLLEAERRIPGPWHRQVVGCRCWACGWNAMLDRAKELTQDWRS